MLPPIVNDLNSMIKDSCLVSVIGVPELLQTALGVGKAKFIVPKMMVLAAAVYLALCAFADWLGRTLEKKLSAVVDPAGPRSTLWVHAPFGAMSTQELHRCNTCC